MGDISAMPIEMLAAAIAGATWWTAALLWKATGRGQLRPLEPGWAVLLPAVSMSVTFVVAEDMQSQLAVSYAIGTTCVLLFTRLFMWMRGRASASGAAGN